MAEKNEPAQKKNDAAILPNITLLNILSNAAQSAVQYEATAAGTETRKCSACGAARPAGTDLQVCDFCKTSFY